jgi:tetratricopeptide (TPR) repeat protein
VDSQTRHALKQDKFVQATQQSVGWVEENRTSVIRFSIAVVVVLALVIAGFVLYHQRSEAAETAMGSALDVFTSQLAQPGQPVTKGVYATSADRAKAANAQFVQVASQYGWLPVAAKAHYFAGLTYQELGQNASAETELKAAADSWDSNVASLAKFALAGFYHHTGRDGQALEIYNALIAKPTSTVPAFTAQLAEADLYEAAGKLDQAKQIWAKVKDADKAGPAGGGAGPAGAIAAEKLTPKK